MKLTEKRLIETFHFNAINPLTREEIKQILKNQEYADKWNISLIKTYEEHITKLEQENESIKRLHRDLKRMRKIECDFFKQKLKEIKQLKEELNTSEHLRKELRQIIQDLEDRHIG